MRDKIITTDALLTQKTFCQAIIEGYGDYVLPVKNNHPDLYDDVQKLFQGVPDTLSEDETHHRLGDPIYTQELMENHIAELKQGVSKQAQVSTHIWIGQYRTGDPISLYSQNPNTGEETSKVSYGITSLKPEEASAKRLLTLKRRHWSIENKSH